MSDTYPETRVSARDLDVFAKALEAAAREQARIVYGSSTALVEDNVHQSSPELGELVATAFMVWGPDIARSVISKYLWELNTLLVDENGTLIRMGQVFDGLDATLPAYLSAEDAAFLVGEIRLSHKYVGEQRRPTNG